MGIKLNGQNVVFTQFPNKETNIDGDSLIEILSNPYKGTKIELRYESDLDLIRLLFIKRFLDDLYYKKELISLKIYYLPYSRQDRVEGNSVFTLKYIAEFINSLNFASVCIIEPHSDVALAVINNSHAIYATSLCLSQVMSEIGFDPKSDYLFYPDAGASKRYSHLIKGDFNILVGHKNRDFKSGRITKLQVIGDIPLLQRGFKVIIVDDLCSRGGTFMLAGNALREAGAGEVHLLVAHCENTIFQGDVLMASSPITRVFTTDSILDIDSTTNLGKCKITIL